MPDDDLTPVQRSVLLVLMAEAREVPNAYLTNDRKLDLKKERRDQLEERSLITVRRQGRLLFLELSERGARWCNEQRGDEVPPGAGHAGAAAYSMLAGIHRHLERHNLHISEFFSRSAPVAAGSGPATGEAEPAADIETRIRKAYHELAGRPGSWVRLADLRPLLGEPARAEVDRVLVQMNRAPGVSIVPESDQKTLTERDRAAAVQIGNQDRHVMMIESS